MKNSVQFIYFNAGGGHRSAALALQEVMAQKHPQWSVELVNIFEVLDAEGYYQKWTGFAPEDLYNLRLKRGWTRGLATELKWFQSMIRLSLPTLKKKMQAFWRASTRRSWAAPHPRPHPRPRRLQRQPQRTPQRHHPRQRQRQSQRKC